MNFGINKTFSYMETHVPIGELNQDNYATYFRQLFLLLGSFFGIILCTISMYTQRDSGTLNLFSLILLDLFLILNIYLVKKQKEKIAAYMFVFGHDFAVSLSIFEDGSFLSSGFLWYLLTPIFLVLFLEGKELIAVLIANIIIYLGLQLYFYPDADEMIAMQGGMKATKYWMIENVEFITIYVTILIVLYSYNYVNNYLKLNFLDYKNKLLQASKLSALGEMAGNIGHEINNPLTIIKASTFRLKKAIKKDIVDVEKIISTLDLVDETVIRMANIISSLKMMSRQESGEKEKISIEEIIEGIVPIFEIQMQQYEINFKLKLSENESDKIYVNGSSVELSQVILNLLNNAIYAAKVNKTPSVSLELCSNNNNCCIQVSDNGLGVPSKVLERIYEPFFTTKPVGEGTGIGLSLCRTIIQNHQGQLSYKRENGITIFEVSLPLLS